MPKGRASGKSTSRPKLPKGPTWKFKERQIERELKRLRLLHEELATAIRHLEEIVNEPAGGGPDPKSLFKS